MRIDKEIQQLSTLEALIEEAQSKAEVHAVNCSKILADDGLASALEYCKNQGIEPPQCSLMAQSVNAENQRNKAKRMLCENKWWKRRLGVKAGRDFEHTQIKEGKVTNFISEESLDYYRAKRKW